MNINKLSIIMPTFNEGGTLHLIVQKINEVKLINGIQKELIIVNDCSTDATKEVSEELRLKYPQLNIKYFEHPINSGKGAALRTGIAAATGEYLIIQDAEMDPEDKKLLARIKYFL